MDIEYCGECSILQWMFSAVERYHHQYCGECSILWWMFSAVERYHHLYCHCGECSILWWTFSTMNKCSILWWMFNAVERYHHLYCGECSILWWTFSAVKRYHHLYCGGHAQGDNLLFSKLKDFGVCKGIMKLRWKLRTHYRMLLLTLEISLVMAEMSSHNNKPEWSPKNWQ